MTKKYHPHPWTAEHGQIKQADGWVIGNYPYSLGDELDHNSGELMAKAPEIRAAAEMALLTIYDVLRCETLTNGSRDALEAVTKDLKEVIT